MNRRLVFLTLAYLLLPLAALLALTLFAIRRIPDVSQPHQDALASIYNEKPFVQHITPRHNGFSTAIIHLKNASLTNTDPLSFILSNDVGQTLRLIQISGRNIGDPDSVRFQFDPIPDSAGKSYTITLQTPYTNFDQPKIEAGVANSGDLTYELYYRPQSRAELISSVLASLLPKLSSLQLLILLTLVFFVSYLTLSRKLHTSGV